MIRFVLRFVGFVILAAAFAALLYDGTKTIAGSDIYYTKLGEAWTALHPTSLLALKPAVEHYVGAWLWDSVVLQVLAAPSWLVLGILGAFFILIGRKKKPLIGYAR